MITEIECCVKCIIVIDFRLSLSDPHKHCSNPRQMMDFRLLDFTNPPSLCGSGREKMEGATELVLMTKEIYR